MEEVAGWIALVATLTAALMTAANLGARVTGWGFVMFTLGTMAWIVADVLGAETPLSLLVTHCVLLLVNVFGVWRWLGRHARYEDSRKQASERSRWARVPTLFSAGSLIGATVAGREKDGLGTVVDAMFDCEGKRIAYVVISEGGIAGAGETLRAVPPEHLRFEDGTISCELAEADWRALQPIEDDHWPTKAPPPVKGG